MLDARALIEKHRSKGAFIDTNLLVLLLVGNVNRRRIRSFKRTQNFSIEDFELLNSLMSWFGELITTPHVLGQLSDLTDVPGTDLPRIRRLFKFMGEQAEEWYDPSRILVSDPIFERLGLTDAAIATVSSRGVLIVTADIDLQLAIQRRGADALNFNHARQLAWNWN